MDTSQENSIVTFTYKNWQGVVEKRTAIPHNITFGDTGKFHNHKYDWYLSAFCCERGADRTFLLCDISDFQVTHNGKSDGLLITVLQQKLREHRVSEDETRTLQCGEVL